METMGWVLIFIGCALFCGWLATRLIPKDEDERPDPGGHVTSGRPIDIELPPKVDYPEVPEYPERRNDE